MAFARSSWLPAKKNAPRTVPLGATTVTEASERISDEGTAEIAITIRPYAYVLSFGRAKKTREGDQITIVTWGAMVPRCEAATEGISADVIDLRTLMPWDRETVLESVRATRRLTIG